MPTDAQHTKAHPKQKSPPSLINPLLISSIALRAAHSPSVRVAKKGPGHSRQQVVRGWRSAPILEQHTIELEHAEILLLIVKVVVFFVSTSARLAHRDAVLVGARWRVRQLFGEAKSSDPAQDPGMLKHTTGKRAHFPYALSRPLVLDRRDYLIYFYMHICI